MKKKILLLVLILANYSFSQTKKDQINYLNYQIDSIRAVQLKDQQDAVKIRTELKYQQNRSNAKIESLESEVALVKKELKSSNEQLVLKVNQITILENRLKQVQDSLKEMIMNKPIELLSDEWMNLPDDEILELINISHEELGEYFFDEFNPNKFPDFSVLGKQVFIKKAKKYVLVIIGVNNPNDCHGCHGTNFLVLLEDNNSIWRVLNKTNAELNQNMGWGMSSDLEGIYKNGEHSVAIILESGMSGQGSSLSNYSMYILNQNNVFEYVFSGLSFESDKGVGGQIENEYSLSFKDNGKKYYDLIETKKSHGKVVSTRVLSFNNSSLKYE